MQQIKYIIEVLIKSFVIVYMNYFVILFIIQQIKLSSSSINKLNLRLIRISIYLSQFFLKIKHKLNSQHKSINAFRFVVNSFVLDDDY